MAVEIERELFEVDPRSVAVDVINTAPGHQVRKLVAFSRDGMSKFNFVDSASALVRSFFPLHQMKGIVKVMDKAKSDSRTREDLREYVDLVREAFQRYQDDPMSVERLTLGVGYSRSSTEFSTEFKYNPYDIGLWVETENYSYRGCPGII
jgi:hypothetical protein